MIGIKSHIYRNIIRDKIYKEEGKRRLPYLCSNGHLTVGVGHNLDEPMSDELIELILNYDIKVALKQIKKQNVLHIRIHWKKLPLNARIVICDMCFQMGLTRLRKFKKMLKAIADKDYKKASEELLDSKYAKQTPNRANRNAELLRNCKS